MNLDGSQLLEKVYELLTIYGIKFLAAIAIYIIGKMIAKSIKKLAARVMKKKNVDPTISGFVVNLLYVALLAFIIIAALNQLGIQTASFIAILGAAGLAIGLALQGSLSNFAAGVLMIIFRPFSAGDLIEGAGVTGVVEEIQIFTTQLKTADNKTVIIPNSNLMNDNIINYSVKGTRRVDMLFGIGYEDDIDKSRSIIMEIMQNDQRVLKDPEPVVLLSELADSSVNFSVRAWAKSEDYWGVYFDTTEKVKKQFDAAGISIPFPQQDVHVHNHNLA
jgi:small conductance mechanosensitive channel